MLSISKNLRVQACRYSLKRFFSSIERYDVRERSLFSNPFNATSFCILYFSTLVENETEVSLKRLEVLSIIFKNLSLPKFKSLTSSFNMDRVSSVSFKRDILLLITSEAEDNTSRDLSRLASFFLIASLYEISSSRCSAIIRPKRSFLLSKRALKFLSLSVQETMPSVITKTRLRQIVNVIVTSIIDNI